ncbi:hypothetical protein V1279_000178 [Bradyrhizobium sp. AZCC 1610]
MPMLPSLHDDFLVAYEVNCEARQIKLYAKPDTRAPRNEKWTTCTIVFNGVEGYQFEHDAFGNIIYSLDAVPVEQLLTEFGSQIAESYRMGGAPGPWAADLASAGQMLVAMGVRGFILSSSYGLSGWVLAKEALVEQT